MNIPFATLVLFRYNQIVNRRTQGSNRFPQSKPAIADHSSCAILARSRVRRRSSPAFGVRRVSRRNGRSFRSDIGTTTSNFPKRIHFPAEDTKGRCRLSKRRGFLLTLGRGSPSGLPPLLKVTRHCRRHRRLPKREGDHPYVSYIHELCFKFKGSFRHPGGTCKTAVRRHLRESAPFRRNPGGKTHNINRKSVFPDRYGREKGNKYYE